MLISVGLVPLDRFSGLLLSHNIFADSSLPMKTTYKDIVLNAVSDVKHKQLIIKQIT